MKIGDVTAVLLCAGLSQRFGPDDKLMALLDGRPVAAHIAAMLATLPLAARIAVVGDATSPLIDVLGPGWQIVVNPGGAGGQQASLKIGLAAAGDAAAVMLLLGDMPFVTASHLRALIDAATDSRPAASRAPDWTGPPWVASVPWLATASPLRDALRAQALAILAPPGTLHDIDTLADLQNRPGFDSQPSI